MRYEARDIEHAFDDLHQAKKQISDIQRQLEEARGMNNAMRDNLGLADDAPLEDVVAEIAKNMDRLYTVCVHEIELEQENAKLRQEIAALKK